ncbi:MAG TPA: hypothetical protein VF011_08425 [Terriglobales bacterium]
MSYRVSLLAVMVAALSLAGWAQSTQPRMIETAWQNGYGQYPAYGQPARLSPDDQQKFDHYYQKWMDASRKNDRDDIDKNARHMQDIMAHYNIPQNVPFGQIATNSGNAGYGYQNNGAYGQNGAYGYPANGQSRLSPDDQRKFDDYYQKWMDASRKNDNDDIQSSARHMQDIMAHYNIPPNVPFDQIATNGTGGYGYQGNNAYGNGAYGYPAAQSRLSSDDQNKFDHYYQKWVDARRKNDRDDIDKNARHMQDIMAHYNIPANVPFDRVASASANRY